MNRLTVLAIVATTAHTALGQDQLGDLCQEWEQSEVTILAQPAVIEPGVPTEITLFVHSDDVDGCVGAGGLIFDIQPARGMQVLDFAFLRGLCDPQTYFCDDTLPTPQTVSLGAACSDGVPIPGTVATMTVLTEFEGIHDIHLNAIVAENCFFCTTTTANPSIALHATFDSGAAPNTSGPVVGPWHSSVRPEDPRGSQDLREGPQLPPVNQPFPLPCYATLEEPIGGVGETPGKP